MPFPRTRRRSAVIGGVAVALTLAALPGAGADSILGGNDPTDTVDGAFAPQLVTVTADLDQRNIVANSGLDVTEHAGHDYVEVVLHSHADLEVLESLGLPYEVRIADLGQRESEIQAINAAYAASVDESPLPSGRDNYRLLEDYNADMVQLAADHPDVVRLFKLPLPSIEGKDILGVEIASNLPADTTPDEVDVIEPSTDERPTFVLMGLHHAREWPSGEHAIEFAIDLATNYGQPGQERITGLVDQVRTLVIPVVNPDGFEKSVRDGMAGLDLRPLNDTGADPLGGQTSILATPGNAYKRKNCRVVDGAPGVPGACDVLASPGGFGIGVDLNRNYGAFHGGPGAAAEPPHATYRGPEGFSEPETQNIREVVSQRHVTMLISNHTFSNLVLRPNGVNPQTIGPDGLPIGNAPDEDAMAQIGALMTAENGYANIHGWELYDTTGTTEDWSYNATGGFGYTFEIGPDEFHPPFPHVVDEYFGTSDYHGDDFTGGGNREAYLIAMEHALHPASHSVLEGVAPRGSVLRLTRTGSTPTWEGSFADTVATVLETPDSREFRWHVNPSTRPVVDSKQYSILDDAPAKQEELTGTVPAQGEHVDVPWFPAIDANLVNVSLDWTLPDDLDLEVYKVEGGKATQVTSSGNIPGEKEFTTLVDVAEGAEYFFRVINFAAVPEQPFTIGLDSFQAETITTTGLVEVWTLTCEMHGEIVEKRPVFVERGQQVRLGKVCGTEE